VVGTLLRTGVLVETVCRAWLSVSVASLLAQAPFVEMRARVEQVTLTYKLLYEMLFFSAVSSGAL
jgi:hypothetical protein